MLNRPNPARPARTGTELSLRTDLIDEAQRLDIDLAAACEHGLREAIAKIQGDRWYQENREAVDYWNRYVEEHGLPLARYRQF